MKQVQPVFRFVVAVILGLALAWPAVAQQRGRRVFTNEDFPAAPPPPAAAAPAPAEAAAAPAPDAAPGAPAPDADPDAGPLAPPVNREERLQRLADAQAVLQFMLSEFSEKEEQETTAEARERWRTISMAMLSVLQGYQQLLAEAQQQVQQQQNAPPPPAQ